MPSHLRTRISRRTQAHAAPITDLMASRLSWVASALELGVSPSQAAVCRRFHVSQGTVSKDFHTLVGVVNACQEAVNGALRLGVVAGKFFTGTVQPHAGPRIPDDVRSLVGLTLPEVLACRNWKPVKDDPPLFDWEDLGRHGLSRVEVRQLLRDLEGQKSRFFYRAEDYIQQQHDQGLLVDLYKACRESREVSFSYLSLSDKNRGKGYMRRSAVAHVLVDALGRLHLSAFEIEGARMKDFVLSRMKDVSVGKPYPGLLSRQSRLRPAPLRLQLGDSSAEMSQALRRAYGRIAVMKDTELVMEGVPGFLHQYVQQLMGVVRYDNPYFESPPSAEKGSE